jgi:hypothetical protein
MLAVRRGRQHAVHLQAGRAHQIARGAIRMSKPDSRAACHSAGASPTSASTRRFMYEP